MNSKLISCANKAVYPHVVKAALHSRKEKVAVFCQGNTVRLIWLYYWYKTTIIKYNTAFYFGVYLPCDNDIAKFKQSITLMQSLYTYYDKYGKVLFSGGVFNASLLLEYHTNAVKSKLLCGFVELCNFCVPMLDFFCTWRAI